jgi:response regulator RpfG family c-di-GMP phosphodiesterase
VVRATLYIDILAINIMNNSIRVLVVEDDRSMLELIGSALSMREKYEVVLAADSETALQKLNQMQFNAVISDINLPGMNGLDLLSRISLIDSKVPVILITGYAEVSIMQTAIKLGVFDFLKKPFNLSELQISVRQAVLKNQLLVQNEAYTNQLEQLVEKKAKELCEANNLLEINFARTVLAMINALEACDIYTKGHSERVTNISLIIGQTMNLSSQEIKSLRTGAIFHDLGKIGIYPALLNKPATLTMEEYDLIRQHPSIGGKIIKPIALDIEITNIVVQHHERYDGKGYPLNLKNHDISNLAKIVAIADAYDAMTSMRIYREMLSHEQACEEIIRCSGSQFDPIFVEYFVLAAEKQDFRVLDTPPLTSYFNI